MDTRTNNRYPAALSRLRPDAPLLLLVLLLVLPVAAGAQGLGNGGSDLVTAYIERTDELIMWAGELVAETESGTARRVLQQARDLNRRAMGEVDRGQVRQGGKIAQRARSAVWHAVKQAREAMGLQERLRIRAERFIDLHMTLTERARDVGNEEAMELLNRAQNQARRAREQQQQGEMDLAWQMFERAEDLTLRAARLLADTGDPERMRAEIERTAELIERAAEAQRGEPTRRAQRQLGEAEEALVRARAHLDQGEPGRALQMITLARRLAHGALDSSVAPAGPEAVERQLQRFDERAQVVGERIADSDNEQARQMLGRARDHRERAAGSLAAGKTEQALRQVRTAHDLLNQAEAMMR